MARSGVAPAALLVSDELRRVRAAEATTRERLEELAAGLDGARRVRSHVASEAEPAPAILGFARRHGAECVVVASHGRRGVDRWLFGSVAAAVARRCDVPVVLVHPGRRRARAQRIDAARAVSLSSAARPESRAR
jgi:nucleotide-binding universal stress UspA family protein